MGNHVARREDAPEVVVAGAPPRRHQDPPHVCTGGCRFYEYTWNPAAHRFERGDLAAQDPDVRAGLDGDGGDQAGGDRYDVVDARTHSRFIRVPRGAATTGAAAADRYVLLWNRGRPPPPKRLAMETVELVHALAAAAPVVVDRPPPPPPPPPPATVPRHGREPGAAAGGCEPVVIATVGGVDLELVRLQAEAAVRRQYLQRHGAFVDMAQSHVLRPPDWLRGPPEEEEEERGDGSDPSASSSDEAATQACVRYHVEQLSRILAAGVLALSDDDRGHVQLVDHVVDHVCETLGIPGREPRGWFRCDADHLPEARPDPGWPDEATAGRVMQGLCSLHRVVHSRGHFPFGQHRDLVVALVDHAARFPRRARCKRTREGRREDGPPPPHATAPPPVRQGDWLRQRRLIRAGQARM